MSGGITRAPARTDLLKNYVQPFGNTPLGIVGLHFAEIAVVANVVADARFLDVFEPHRLAGNAGRAIECFQDAARILLPATQVINLAAAGFLPKLIYKAGYVERVNVVSDLLSLVAKNLVCSPFEIALHQVTEKTVEFDAGVVRPGETAAAEATRLEAEIAAIFLDHHVCRHLAGTEQTVLALVDRKIFWNAGGKGRVAVIPARGEFFPRDGVGPVPVNFIRAHVDENGIPGILARCFQQVQRATGIDVEIIERPAGGQVVAGLGSGMNDERWFQFRHELGDFRSIANIEFEMLKGGPGVTQSLLIPASISLRAEEIAAHVVVDAKDAPIARGEVGGDFGADQAGGTGDEKCILFPHF